MSCLPAIRRILIGRLGLSRPYLPNLQPANEGEYSGSADTRRQRGTVTIRASAGHWRSRAGHVDWRADGELPHSLNREAVKRLPAPPRRRSPGRAWLAYGKWLRREHRRVD